LLKRKNVAEALICFYENISFECLVPGNSVVDFSIQLASLEFLFSKQEILSQMSYKGKQKTVSLLLSKYNQWQEIQIDGWYMSGIIPVMAIVMHDSQYLPIIQYYDNNQNFGNVKAGYAMKDQFLDILSFAKDFIKN
jgi:hypothetical protein